MVNGKRGGKNQHFIGILRQKYIANMCKVDRKTFWFVHTLPPAAQGDYLPKVFRQILNILQFSHL